MRIFKKSSPKVAEPELSLWEEIAATKRNELLRKIPEEWMLPKEIVDEAKRQSNLTKSFIEELLDSETRKITNLDSVELVDAISNSSLTAVQVTTAFCKRAAFAHQLNNNLLEIMFESAIERAEELDRHFSKTHEPIGPLHGLPISLKDQFHVKWGETTMAYVGWIGTFEGEKGTGKEGKFESELVRELVALGAIPIAKTTLTQTLWCAETNNNILGYNWNPHNQALSSGGSSGGQGAFQALRGTTLGFGTDVGGSVSIPAAFNGLYSLKPSHGRLPFRGVPNSSPGQTIIPTIVGLFGTNISCLQLAFRSLMAAKPWLSDHDVLEMPCNEDAIAQIENKSQKQHLYFGIMENDGIVGPHPPILRAIRMVKEALMAKGYKTVPWQPPSHVESAVIHCGITNADGAPDVIECLKLSGEPVIPELKTEFGDEPQPPMSLLTFNELTLRLKRYREEYEDYWLSTSEGNDEGDPVDAVILPVAPHAAVIPGRWYHYTYATMANTLDSPTVVIPVTTANSYIDVFDPHYEPSSKLDRKNWLSYDAEKYDGAPAAVQILGTRLGEEKLLRVAQVVVDALNDYKLGL